MLQERLPGIDQTSGCSFCFSCNSSLHINLVQLESAIAPPTDPHLPDDLLCTVSRDDFCLVSVQKAAVTIAAKMDASKNVSYRCKMRTLAASISPNSSLTSDDVNVLKGFLAAILEAPGDSTYLLPSEAGRSWAPQHTQTR